MKLFHLADCHIGKRVNGRDMLEDQVHALEQVLAAIDREAPDALLLAGDLYDRRNPNVEAVDLFDRFLSQVVLERGVPVLAIGGNHDSGERLDFGSGLLARAGLYLAGALRLPVPRVRLSDADGPVDFWLFPYADLALMRHLRPELAALDYAGAVAALLDELELDPAARQVLIAHGVVGAPGEGLVFSDSERELSIGGTEYWTHASLDRFDYVALGHLHRPQEAGAAHIRYAGSLCKYSFSEESHEKRIQVVELDRSGLAALRAIPLLPLHEMRTLEGRFDDILAAAPTASWREDYLRVILTDPGLIHEPMARLRAHCPNILSLERRAMELRPSGRASGSRRQRTPYEQIGDFLAAVTPEDGPVDAAMQTLVRTLLEEDAE